MSIQPIELPDREIHVFPAKLLGEMGGGGVGGRGVKNKEEIFGGVALANSVGGRGCWSEKNFQI